jgi:flagellar biosynthesis activator protein FlaF
MTFEAYETVVEDSGREARARERTALSSAIDRLEKLKTGTSSAEESVMGLLHRALGAVS